jgi:division protein CdvB (Snf7/Vps24/ESCRT-III family)
LTQLKDKWTKQPQPSISEKFNDLIKPKGPLKPRVQTAIKKLSLQISKLDNMLTKLQERDGKLFQRIVEKVTKILSNARIALERIELRLTTTNDIGDTVMTIMPTMGLMKNLKSSLGKIMPGAEQEIGQMADMLGGFMTESFAGDGAFGIDESTNMESDKILQEAAAVAENSAGDMFPSVPASTSSTETSSSKFY